MVALAGDLPTEREMLGITKEMGAVVAGRALVSGASTRLSTSLLLVLSQELIHAAGQCQ